MDSSNAVSGFKRQLNKAVDGCKSKLKASRTALASQLNNVEPLRRRKLIAGQATGNGIPSSRRLFMYEFEPMAATASVTANERLSTQSSAKQQLADNSDPTETTKSRQQAEHHIAGGYKHCAQVSEYYRIKQANTSQYQEANKSDKMAPTTTLKISTHAHNHYHHHHGTKQHFVRSSALMSSARRRSSRRRRSAHQIRQVRFEPIPQAINISNNQDDSIVSSASTQDANTDDANHNNNKGYYEFNPSVSADEKSPKHEKRNIQTMPKHSDSNGSKTFCRNKIKTHLNIAKPFAKKLHTLSHVKIKKLKLRGFNNFANQIHQTLTSAPNFTPATNPSVEKQNVIPLGKATCSTTTPSSSQIAAAKRQTTMQQVSLADNESNLDNNNEEKEEKEDVVEGDDDLGWGSDFDDSQSVDSSQLGRRQAGDQSGYMLEFGKSSSDFRAIEDVIQDQGISGQFKPLNESPVRPNLQPTIPRPSECSSSGNNNNNNNISHRVRIEYERRECELLIRENIKMADEKEQKEKSELEQHVEHAGQQEKLSNKLDNGTLECCNPQPSTPVEKAPQQAPVKTAEDVVGTKTYPDLQEGDDDDEDDDEEELRSLEARQGFKQIRDKLKVILDQRLATFEKNLTVDTAPQSETPSSELVVRTKISSGVTYGEQATRGLSAMTKSSSPEKLARENNDNEDVDARVIVQTRDFDCHSQCSDESAGLDSNHSESQDSGHGTQHSGCSARTSCKIHHNRISEDEANDSGQRNSLESRRIESDSSEHCVDSPISPVTSSKIASDDESEERRMRFMQNRLIINNKLESLFKNRSPVKENPTVANCGNHHNNGNSCASKESSPQGRRQISAPVALAQSLSAACLPANPMGQPSPSLNKGQASNPELHPTSAQMRLKLLEQQRQMSLKLKQKPRRKSIAKLGLNINDSNLVVCKAGTSVDNGNNFIDKDTSQCDTTLDTAYNIYNCMPFSLQTKPAMSLRQLVTDVIDDYEKPTKLSAYTKNILSRSYSLSSELAASADDIKHRSEPNSDQPQQQQTQEAVSNHLSTNSTSSSLNSLTPTTNQASNDDKSRCSQLHLEDEEDREATSGPTRLVAATSQPAYDGFVYPVSPWAIPQHAHQLIDQSLSSVGTIDGLEYCGNSSGDETLQNGEMGQNKTGAKSHLGGVHKSIGSYLVKNLKEFSRFKLPKATRS